MLDPDQAANDPFRAGMAARAQGEPATACPYPEAGDEREQWLAGWHKPDLAEPEELGFA